MGNAGSRIGWTLGRVAKYVLVTSGVLFVLLVAAIGLAPWWMSVGVFTTDRFDVKAWSRAIADAEEATCYRGGMARDIEKRLLKPGMSKSDVERLLGQPNGGLEPREYRYILGMCSGFMLDYDDLHVYFNEQGFYERSAIIQH